MAIRIRRGNKIDFDPNKMVAGELGLALDSGELYFCYSPGNVKRLQTAEDLQNLLNASEEAYTALQQLVSDLAADPNELANILSNISNLQDGLTVLEGGLNDKIDKTEKGVTIPTLDQDGKVPSEQLPEIASSADKITYDNTESGLDATNTQDAIDEVSSQLADILKKSENIVTPEMFGATGGSNDSQAFQDAVDYLESVGGGVLLVPKGTWHANFVVGMNITIQGVGQNITTIKSVSGSNKDVIKSKNFDELSLLPKNSVANSETQLGSSFLNIRDINIHGNKENNTAGCGIKVFGFGFHWNNVSVVNCAEDGIYTQFVQSITPSDNMVLYEIESMFSHIKSFNNNKSGFVFYGPHDAYFNGVHLAKNGEWGLKNYSNLRIEFINCYTNQLGGIYSEASFNVTNLQLNNDYGLFYTDFEPDVPIDYGIYSMNGGCRICNGTIDGFAKGIYVKGISGNFTIDDLKITRTVQGLEIESSNQINANVEMINVKYGFNIISETHNNRYSITANFNETTNFLLFPTSQNFREKDIVEYNGIVSENSFTVKNGLRNSYKQNWTMPTSGTFKKLEYVTNNTPNIIGTDPEKYIVRGWLRLTDGSTHVLNTDWVEDRIYIS